MHERGGTRFGHAQCQLDHPVSSDQSDRLHPSHRSNSSTRFGRTFADVSSAERIGIRHHPSGKIQTEFEKSHSGRNSRKSSSESQQVETTLRDEGQCRINLENPSSSFLLVQTVVPKTAEQCASSLHHHFEEYVNASEIRVEQAHQGETKGLFFRRKRLFSLAAYLSFIRYYASFSREWKYLFHVKNLHRGHVAKSFGLRQLPDESNNHSVKERQRTFGSLEKSIFVLCFVFIEEKCRFFVSERKLKSSRANRRNLSNRTDRIEVV